MQNLKYKDTAKKRSDILTLLTEASEVEHGLACSYLYTAFSLKQTTDEGITWEELHMIKKWAGQIFFVASEEMLHLAQVWNLTLAIGGVPYYHKPNFPINSKYYHFDLPVSLEPFSENTIKLFKSYELPKDLSEKEYIKENFSISFEDAYDYKTVGDLYEMIADGIRSIPEEELFIGDPTLQVGSDLIDFPDIVKVTDHSSALSAISLIVEQGEGSPTEKENSHFHIFSQILEEYKHHKKHNRYFQPTREIIANPITYNKGNLGIERGNLITNPFTACVSDLFDDLYVLMMQILQFVFISREKEKVKPLGNFAIHIMPTVIKPLSESLHMLSAGTGYLNLGAGPAFTTNRHISYPEDYSTTKVLIAERLVDILNRGEDLTQEQKSPPVFTNAIRNLKQLINELAL